MEPLKPARKNGSMSAPQSPALSAQPPLGDGETWMMGGPRFLLTGPREVAVLRGSASGPTGSFGRAPPAHSRIPPSILLSRNGPGSMMPHAVVASPLYWVLAQGRQLHWSSLSLAPQSREREPQAQPHHLLCTMSVRKRTLLKVIILGDSGCVSPPPAAPKTPRRVRNSECAYTRARRVARGEGQQGVNCSGDGEQIAWPAVLHDARGAGRMTDHGGVCGVTVVVCGGAGSTKLRS